MDLKKEILGLKVALKEANDQCTLLFNEVQKAWKVSFTLQSDLKVSQCSLCIMSTKNYLTPCLNSFISLALQSENKMLAEKEKVEKEQNLQLKNQVSRLLHIEQEQKTQIRDRDLTIQSLQVNKNSFYSCSCSYMSSLVVV